MLERHKHHNETLSHPSIIPSSLSTPGHVTESAEILPPHWTYGISPPRCSLSSLHIILDLPSMLPAHDWPKRLYSNFHSLTTLPPLQSWCRNGRILFRSLLVAMSLAALYGIYLISTPELSPSNTQQLRFPSSPVPRNAIRGCCLRP